ncbi:small conductance mechanosensitive channel [Alicyclobacillus sacchari]|uniref:Small conductance mechanosensitive channel n=1 Tax=Alicyclobacillus sacchari TaxID=392010 RepID=A0A4R8LGW5_9BACL|nr:mechanosensitive ion channel family protein [Alicyclobacillus sacchari]TDY42394.1 small conductance mechanosensitive channel [Alicyclobacillus sacchari]
MQSFWKHIQDKAFSDMPSVEVVIWDVVKIAVFYLLARLVIRAGIRIMKRMLAMHTRMELRRKATMESLFANVIRYTVYFVLVVQILAVFHVNVSAILAGAGIVGVAVGFGAQSLVKDVITGLFILFEDQYAVGDTVQINGFTGTVVSIGVRLTRVQAWTGEVQVIPNGQIAMITNFSRTHSTAVIDITVPYDTDVNQVKSVMECVLSAMKREQPDVLTGDIHVLGVQEMSNSNVVVRATAICAPTKNASVQREAQERIKEALDRLQQTEAEGGYQHGTGELATE